MSSQINRAHTTILVIDDEESILNLVSVILSNRGYNVAKACDAKTGLELIDALNPSLVLLDYMMPLVDGLETLKKIRQEYPDIYVIMFTGK